MKYLYYAILIFLISIIQPTLITSISVFGITANIFLVSVLLVGFFRGKYEGAIYGLISGFIFGVVSGNIIGFDAILYMYLGLLAGVFSDSAFQVSHILIAVAAVFVASVIYGITKSLVYMMILDGVKFWFTQYRLVLIEAVYDAVIAIPLFYIIRRTMTLMRLKVR